MPLALIRTTDATVEPVSYPEAAAHARVTSDDEQDYVTALITAARQYVEEATHRQLVTATWTLRLDTFPCADVIQLPRPRLIAVTSIVYLDAAGVSQTWDSANYQVDPYSEPGRIARAPGVTWPTTESQRRNAVVITYTAGYGATAASVPLALRQAIKLLVSHWYENREPAIIGSIVSPLPMAVDALIAPYRVGTQY
jgi:uncharacterized phiE125 gp8 family phage protein